MRAEWRLVVNRTSEEEIVKKLSELGLIVIKTEKGYVIFDKNTIGVIKYGCLEYLKGIEKTMRELEAEALKCNCKGIEDMVEELRFRINEMLYQVVGTSLAEITKKCVEVLRVRIETKDIKVAEEMTKIFGMPDGLEL